MPTPLTRRERRIASKYRRMKTAQDKAAAEYAKADRLAVEIANDVGGHGHVSPISEERQIEVTDNYEAARTHPKLEPGDMPKGWAHAALRQFSIEEARRAAS